jgi:hypothetical protein
MLLRRFLTHFNKQDWLAICLDFVIVVVGIFVGLQVDAWNQDRKDRARERVSLEQLYIDFGQAEQQARSFVEFHDGKASELQFAIDRILALELPSGEHRRFNLALVSMLQLPPLGATMGAYESMVAAGDFGLIRDDQLKSMLIELDAQLEAEASLLDYFRTQNARDFGFARQHLPIVPTADRSGTTFALDFEGVANDPETLTILSTHQRTHRIFSGFRKYIADLFSAARTHIGTLIDVEPDASGAPQAEPN